MVYLEGQSLAETAAALKCKDVTLRSWLNRAREKLRIRLARRGVSVSVPALVAWLVSGADAAAAAVPPDLGAAMAKGAMVWTAGGAAAAGISANVVAMAKGAIQTMFISKLKTAAVVTIAAAVVSTASVLCWDRVCEACERGLTRTAIARLAPIAAQALQNKNYPEATKAICMKIALEAEIDGRSAAEKVMRLQNAMTNTPAAMQPMMEAILANWFWHYFQDDRWRIQERTRTSEVPGQDFTTWDLPHILTEIDKHFTAALANENELKGMLIENYNDLLHKGNVPDTYRPTVFDFLAHDALAFYQAGEQGVVMAEDEFEITADSPVFMPVGEFLTWQPETTDTDSPKLKAITLLQNLLAFHQNDTNKTAFMDCDLLRLEFGKNHAVGADVDEKYKAALQRFAGEWAGQDISARALFAWASVLYSENELAEAHGLAKRGAEAYPKSYGGAQCYNLVQAIEARQININTERVWNEPWPVVVINYKNLTNVWFRAVPYDFEALIRRNGSHGWWDGDDWFNEKLTAKLIAKQAAAQWNAVMPATPDFRERTEKIAVPKDLKPGFYFILASHDPSFRKKDNQVLATFVWVSELALVVRPGHYLTSAGHPYEGDTLDGFVLQARTGDPVAGATVRSWSCNGDQTTFTPGPATKTDENGMFRFVNNGGECRDLHLLAQSGDQMALCERGFYLDPNSKPTPSLSTQFFTDRSLYRPGQTIRYKGICFRADGETNDYATLAGQALTVVLRDPHGVEVARQQHTANDYGSFSGRFTAPAGTLTGRMTLSVEDGPGGLTEFQVEEYKRPTFQITLSPPKEAGTLGATIPISGQVTAYTGTAVGEATVNWRVTRQMQFPHWCWWQRASRQDVAHGTTMTDGKGLFTFTFPATPDLSVPANSEPVFTFTVSTDVTATTGENRFSDHRLRMGYTALTATITADEWQTQDRPVEWTVGTRSLDGEPQAAEGTLKVYALQQPEKVARPSLVGSPSDWSNESDRSDLLRGGAPPPDPANPDSWALADVVAAHEFKIDATGSVKIETPLKVGIYRAMVETKDPFGKLVTARKTVQVMDVKATKYPVKLASQFVARNWSVEPGEIFTAMWGTGYETGRAYVELQHRGKTLRAFWTGEGRTQEMIEQAVTEEMRGGFRIRVTYVRENRAYTEDRVVEVPWSNKKLTVKWEHFTSKLQPGKEETWTAVVTGPDGNAVSAEMVATLYDASLDQYYPHLWKPDFTVFTRDEDTGTGRYERDNVFRREPGCTDEAFGNGATYFRHLIGDWSRDARSVEDRVYRHYPSEISSVRCECGYLRKVQRMVTKLRNFFSRESRYRIRKGSGVPSIGPDLDKLPVRKNLNETAFFFPHLVSDAEGVVRMEFTMPEALTEWMFMGFVHDKDLRSGFLTDKAVTAKDLMVEPNPPRFVREGDVIEFTVKVSNQSAARQTGKVRLTFADARTLKDVTPALFADTRNLTPETSFDIPSKESKTYAWRVSIPDGCDFLTYKAVGATDRLSDGEEGYLPVLSRRILVTESLPLPIRGEQTKKFQFDKLMQSGKSKTLKNENLTVQMVSQPAWYAVMALPYLMETPYECSEAVFNRLYANSLAQFIANSNPKIRRIFDQWKNTPTLDSPLEKNQDLKSVMLEETPWLREAKDESQARRNVGILFDANRLESETQNTFQKLAQMQLGDGLWPWFPGFRGDEYITLYITTGFGRMRHLGAEKVDMAPAIRSLAALDVWMDRMYRDILRTGNKDENHLSSTVAFYLYGRSFFLKDRPIAKEHQEALDYWLGQAKKFWLKLDCRQSQGHLAIALKRFGDAETPLAIMKSIKEFSVSNEELGMFWRDTELSWWWYRAPIETQALMIEAFDEVMGDAQAVEDCKVWLLKQKQTQDWKTTKATADAVYGLLLRGTNLLASDALVEVSLGGETIKPEKVEAGTGFYQQKFVRGEIKPAMGKIEVKKSDAGVSWGSVHWQYLEDMTKITPYEGTPLKVKKTLYRKETTKKGQVLEPVKGALAVGDELVCRIEVRVDRDMEYVHLKDQRGSGTEPVNVLSQAKYQDGLMYYESTRDTASHFFIHYLPKGVYVFEYSVRVQLKGKYQSGIASIQCLYAPEFNSHSESFEIEVK
jgi:hypothetical protein